MSSDNVLIGTWMLASFQLHMADGTVKHPWGNHLIGQVMYSADGYMAGTFMKPDRLRFAAPDVMMATAEESAIAVKSYVGYAGPYSVRGDRVVHHVKVSWFPNWSGTDIERLFEVRDNTLILRTASMIIGGVEATSVGVWEKIAPQTA